MRKENAGNACSIDMDGEDRPVACPFQVKKVNRGMKRNKRTILFYTLVFLLAVPFPALATDQVVSRINSLETLVMGIITAAGAIVLAWGVFDFAAGYQAHDSAQQTASLKKVVAGILMLLAQSVVDMLS